MGFSPHSQINKPPKHMKLQHVAPKQLVTAKYNPAIRTQKKEVKGLLESITKHGILYPILVDKSFNVIDGHRRLHCSKKLKMATVPVIISDTTLTKDECYETINTTMRKMTSNEMIYIYVNGGKVPVYQEKLIAELEGIVGSAQLRKFGSMYISTSVLYHAKSIAGYCEQKNNEFIKQSIFWLLEHKQKNMATMAMASNISKTKLSNAITSNRALKYNFD